MCAGAVFDRLVFKEMKPRSVPIAISDWFVRTHRDANEATGDTTRDRLIRLDISNRTATTEPAGV